MPITSRHALTPLLYAPSAEPGSVPPIRALWSSMSRMVAVAILIAVVCAVSLSA